jgi:type 2 lantibiotic biosynthesis protein LanM
MPSARAGLPKTGGASRKHGEPHPVSAGGRHGSVLGMNETRTPAAAGTAGSLAPRWWLPALTRCERSGFATPGSQANDRPAWCAVAERAVALACAPASLPDTVSWQEAFAIPLRPFALIAQDQVAGAARRWAGLPAADAGALGQSFAMALPGNLAGVALRTFITEVQLARAEGCLTGQDDRERFADFLRRLCTPEGLAGLFARYPVLARLLAQMTQSAADAATELLARLAADRCALIDTLLHHTDPGPVTAIEPGQGDFHQHGRSVCITSFADGRKLVYKPRALDTYAEFGRAAQWLNRQLGQDWLRTAEVLVRPGYGWMEFIPFQPLRHPEDAARFYQRAGILLAVMHALRTTDMHFENIIACGDHPIPVDVETIMHPDLPMPGDASIPDPAAHALAVSVHRTGLLPCFTIGENGMLDRSGLGGDPRALCPEPALDWDPPGSAAARLVLRPVTLPRAAANRPRSNGQVTEPADHQPEILSGFRLGYDAIARHRDAFAALVGSFSATTRVVVRPTSGYASLLGKSTDPGLLRDAADRDRALDLLDEASAGHPLWQRLAPYERAALWDGDVPLILARPASEDLWTGAGEHLPGALQRSGLQCVLDTLATMGEVDRGEQEWIIRASLATRCMPTPHPVPQYIASRAMVPARPRWLLSAVAGIADEIVARSAVLRGEGDQGRLNWLGLQLMAGERWLVLPMGAGLADGYVGVALFFAQLASLTGIARYAEVARCALSPIPQLFAVLTRHAEDVLGDVGCGADAGLGGISYGLARLSTLLADQQMAELAEVAVGLTATAVGLLGDAVPQDWASGLAGCLASMLSVHRQTGSAAAASLAARCADRLVELAEQTDAKTVPPGFAGGLAGIGGALARYAAPAPGSRHACLARSTLRAAAGQIAVAGGTGPGWCCGTAGLLAATASLAGEQPTAEAGTRLRALAERPVLSDLSLRHGELGIVDAATDILADSEDPAVRLAWQRHADRVLAAVQRHAPSCGTPGGIATPGLFDGLAGIGYGLLRLGFPDAVPSVLLLAAPPANR